MKGKQPLVISECLRDSMKADVEVWFSKPKDGAMVVFHGYSWTEGVQRTIDKMAKGNILSNTRWTRIRDCRIRRHDYL